MNWNWIDNDWVREGGYKFDETSLNRLLNHHTENGYAIVSACRADWVPDDELKNRQMNNLKTNELKRDISSAGYQYIPVNGGFIEEDGTEVHETSFIIVNYKNKSGNGEKLDNFDELKELAIDLCRKYNQMSVLVVEPGKNPTYYTKTGDIDMGFYPSISVRKTAQRYFTHLGGGRKFTFMTESEQPSTINEIRSRQFKGEICEMYKNYKVNETSRFQKAKKAFLGQLKNIRNFAIFSPENPMGQKLSDDENAELREQFEDLLRRGHFNYFPIKGKYGNIEHSYFIYNVNVEDVMRWGSASGFNQESFFICESLYDEVARKTGVEFNYYKKDGDNKPFHLIETSEKWFDETEKDITSDKDDYFSVVGKNFKFSIGMNEFGNLSEANDKYELVKEELGEEEFNRYLNDTTTKSGFNTWVKRGKLMAKTNWKKVITETIDGSVKDIIQLKTVDNSLEYSQMYDALQDTPREFQAKLIQTLNSLGQTLEIPAEDTFNQVLCANEQPDVRKKLYNWWRAFFQILSKCQIPTEVQSEYDAKIDELMAEILKAGDSASTPDSGEEEAEVVSEEYDNATKNDENKMMKDMEFAVSKLGEIANKVQAVINYINPYCESKEVINIMKTNERNISDWVSVDDLMGKSARESSVREVEGFKVGDKVIWDDPDGEPSSGWTIVDISYEEGMPDDEFETTGDEIFTLRNEDGSECEALLTEIEHDSEDIEPDYHIGEHVIWDDPDGEPSDGWVVDSYSGAGYDIEYVIVNPETGSEAVVLETEIELDDNYKVDEAFVELESDGESKFKVGDKVQTKSYPGEYTIKSIDGSTCELVDDNEPDRTFTADERELVAMKNESDNPNEYEYTVQDIQWDADDPSEIEDLPTEVQVNVPMEVVDSGSDAVEDYISDYLSDTYGYCHNGFSIYGEYDEGSDDDAKPDEVKNPPDKKFKGDDGEVKTMVAGETQKKRMNEMTVSMDISNITQLQELLWGQAKKNLQELIDAKVAYGDDILQVLEDMGIQTLSELNDLIAYEFETILDSLGVDMDAYNSTGEIKSLNPED